MPGFDGTGPRGMGPMTGGGRGFCSPRGMGAGARRYGIPRGPGYGYRYYGDAWPAPGPQMTPGEELQNLRAEAEALAGQLESIQRRIVELEKKD